MVIGGADAYDFGSAGGSGTRALHSAPVELVMTPASSTGAVDAAAEEEDAGVAPDESPPPQPTVMSAMETAAMATATTGLHRTARLT
jgi:hypothetical protein